MCRIIIFIYMDGYTYVTQCRLVHRIHVQMVMIDDFEHQLHMIGTLHAHKFIMINIYSY